jgi:ketosteroid isomerase-like protein
MKSLSMHIAVLLLAAAAFSQAAPAQRPAGKSSGGGATAAAIEKADKDRSAAIVKADLDAIDKATGDGYVFTDPTGRVSTKKELMDDFKGGKIKIESQDISDVKVHAYGNTAVETGKLTSKGTRDGNDTSGTFRFTRVWVNHNGTWQTVAFQETKTQ